VSSQTDRSPGDGNSILHNNVTKLLPLTEEHENRNKSEAQEVRQWAAALAEVAPFRDLTPETRVALASLATQVPTFVPKVKRIHRCKHHDTQPLHSNASPDPFTPINPQMA
jgi:hypothetical protein